jgi:hypothetical protein
MINAISTPSQIQTATLLPAQHNRPVAKQPVSKSVQTSGWDQDIVQIKRTQSLFSGFTGAAAISLGFLAAREGAKIGSNWGTQAAVAGAVVAGLTATAFAGAALAVVDERIVSDRKAVLSGGALAGAALGYSQAGLSGAAVGSVLGVGAAYIAGQSATRNF